jgi:L-2-hydroxyglutarate oxidase LhgO
METIDCVVLGGGVVELAVARALSFSGREVMVLECCESFGTQTSARCCEVIHAGMYYPTGSRKAQWCVQGSRQLYAYLRAHNLPHRQCGILIVATHADQVPQMEALQAQVRANGLPHPEWLSACRAQHREPALHCVAALWSAETGILDSHAYRLSLCADVEAAGGIFAYQSALAIAEYARSAMNFVAEYGASLRARAVINAAGHHAPDVVRGCVGMRAQALPVARYAKGNYFSLSGSNPFSHHVYPMPARAGLGVHLSLDMGGQARFGPDGQWVDDPYDVTVDPTRAEPFYKAIPSSWPDLPDGVLQPAYAGARSKITGPGEAAADFVVQAAEDQGVPGWINLLGIESAGLTSSLAIADHVAELVC